jgi:hypothetical protein
VLQEVAKLLKPKIQFFTVDHKLQSTEADVEAPRPAILSFSSSYGQ